MTRSERATSIPGSVFVVAFTVSLALLGEEIGAFADSDRAFVEHFSTGSQRGADIAGSGLLAAAPAAFMCFTHLTASKHTEVPNHSAGSSLVRSAGMLAGIFMIVSAIALLTVPLSISMGEFFEEEGKAFGEA